MIEPERKRLYDDDMLESLTRPLLFQQILLITE